MPYFKCPSCGETALRVAQRCPHCGLIFTPDMIPPAEPNRLQRPLLLAGALVALVAVVMVARNQTEPRAAPPRPAQAATVPTESQPEPPVTAIAPPIPVQPPAPARDSTVDSTPPPPAAPPKATPTSPSPTGEQLQRYATTWVNVRVRRGPDAAAVRVLDPGEAVLVDSLVGGWYRVLIDGQSIGYAYGSNLSEAAP
jgi:hypothetical protein